MKNHKNAALPDITPEVLAGKKIAAVTGSAHEAYLKAFFTKSEIVSFPDNDAARSALKDGKADAVFGDGVGLALWIGGTESGRLPAGHGMPADEPRQ